MRPLRIQPPVPYSNSRFWQQYMESQMLLLMENGMTQEQPIRPPKGYSAGHDSQFLVVLNQHVLLAQYFNHLEELPKNTPSVICEYIAEVAQSMIDNVQIVQVNGLVTDSSIELQGVTWYHAEKSTRSQEATKRKLTARHHYVIHYNGFRL